MRREACCTGEGAWYDAGTGRMFIIGGTNGNQVFSDVYSLDLKRMLWTKHEPSRVGGARSGMTARCRHTAVAIRENIYIFGGVFIGFGQTQGAHDIFVLDTTDVHAMRWLRPKVTGRIPQARYAMKPPPFPSRFL